MSSENPANYHTKFNAIRPKEEPLDLSQRHNDKNIIKQSLKSLIQTRRLAEGKELLSVTFSKQEPVAQELSQEELQKQHERKEQNRRAAHKCRQKRKHKLEYFIMEREKLKTKKKWLEQTLFSLEKEKDKLLVTLRTNCRNMNDSENVNDGESEERVNNTKNKSMITNSCLDHNCTPHICCECEYLPKNENSCDQKKFNKINSESRENKHSNKTSYENITNTDDRINFLSYYMKTNPNSNKCSIETNMFENSECDYYSDLTSDSDSSEGYLVIYESDSSDMLTNSQSS